MSINFRAVRGLRQQPLLVCVSSPFNGASAGGFSTKAAANVRKIIELWEVREAPYTAVRSNIEHAQLDHPARSEVFAAGELVFDSVRCSILRNHKFRSFHDDIGAPPIIMIGAGIEFDDPRIGDGRLLVRHTLYNHWGRRLSDSKSDRGRVWHCIEIDGEFRGYREYGVCRK